MSLTCPQGAASASNPGRKVLEVPRLPLLSPSLKDENKDLPLKLTSDQARYPQQQEGGCAAGPALRCVDPSQFIFFQEERGRKLRTNTRGCMQKKVERVPLVRPQHEKQQVRVEASGLHCFVFLCFVRLQLSDRACYEKHLGLIV